MSDRSVLRDVNNPYAVYIARAADIEYRLVRQSKQLGVIAEDDINSYCDFKVLNNGLPSLLFIPLFAFMKRDVLRVWEDGHLTGYGYDYAYAMRGW